MCGCGICVVFLGVDCCVCLGVCWCELGVGCVVCDEC